MADPTLRPIPTLDELNRQGEGKLPGLIGIRFTHVEHGLVRSELTLRDELLAPNGFLHAALSLIHI